MKLKQAKTPQNTSNIIDKKSKQIVCHTCSTFTPENSKDLWKPANLGKQRQKPVVNRTGKNNRRTKV